MRRRLLLLLVVALATLATGCLRVDVAIDVNDDGSGAIRTVQAVDLDAIGQVGGAGAFLPGDLVPDSGQLPDQVRAAPYHKDGYDGVELSADFRNLDELDSRLQDVADAFATTFEGQGVTGLAEGPQSPGDSLANFRIDRTADGWTFEGGGIGDELSPQARQALADTAELRLEVRLPGRPLPDQHNADEVKGNTFVWKLRADDSRDQLFAETGPGSPDSSESRWRWVAVMLGLAALGAFVVVLLARHHGQGAGAPKAPKPPKTPKPPRPPKEVRMPTPGPPPRAGPGESPVDARGWPRYPPAHPPLLPPDLWASVGTDVGGRAPRWAPAAPTVGPRGAPAWAADNLYTGSSGDPYGESTSNRRDRDPYGESTSIRRDRPVTPPPVPASAAMPSAPPGPVAPAEWRPPSNWPNLDGPPTNPTLPPNPPTGATVPLALPPRRPPDLPPTPGPAAGS